MVGRPDNALGLATTRLGGADRNRRPISPRRDAKRPRWSPGGVSGKASGAATLPPSYQPPSLRQRVFSVRSPKFHLAVTKADCSRTPRATAPAEGLAEPAPGVTTIGHHDQKEG